jgi:hypothetical protein
MSFEPTENRRLIAALKKSLVSNGLGFSKHFPTEFFIKVVLSIFQMSIFTQRVDFNKPQYIMLDVAAIFHWLNYLASEYFSCAAILIE